MEIKIVSEKISLNEVKEMARGQYGNMIKAAIDIEKKIMALGGELHSDANEMLTEIGSDQRMVWGINIYPKRPIEERIEFDSLINIKPLSGNKSLYVESEEIRNKIREIIDNLIK
jgi:hypothetical protein